MVKGRRGRLLHPKVAKAMGATDGLYKRPPRWLCQERRIEMPLTDDDVLHVRILEHNHKIVEFAVSQVTAVDGQWVDVARLDTCGGTFHEHLFDSQGQVLVDHRVICEIPPDGGGELLKNLYHDALRTMQNEWADNLRRWRGDRA